MTATHDARSPWASPADAPERTRAETASSEGPVDPRSQSHEHPRQPEAPPPGTPAPISGPAGAAPPSGAFASPDTPAPAPLPNDPYPGAGAPGGYHPAGEHQPGQFQPGQFQAGSQPPGSQQPGSQPGGAQPPQGRPTTPYGPPAPWASPQAAAHQGPGGGQPGTRDSQQRSVWGNPSWGAPVPPGPASGGPGPGSGIPGGPDPFGRFAPATPTPPPMRRRRLVAGALAIALVSAGIGGGVGALVAGDDSPVSVVSTDSGLRQSTAGGGVSPAADNTVSAAAQAILPSVVTIAEESGQEAGTGSGTIIRPDGYILTNNHVVSAAASGGTLTVTMQDGRTFDAEIKATDPSADLAVIKIDGTDLPAATFGDSTALQVGELVVAVGSPLGLNGTVTSGIVSALHRPVRTGDQTVRDQQNTVLDAIQTDAPINPGNSGGPLVNSRGEIVGVNTAIATVGGSSSPFGGAQQSGNIGVGFAIPGSYAEKVAGQLINNGTARHPYLGVSAATAGENTRSTAASGTGAQIRSLVGGGPAERAGLRPGDVITKVGDRAVTDVDSLIAAVRSHDIGNEVEVTYQRDGQTGTVTVTLLEQPPNS
ncbi:S1C family serine protease [Parafrankia sp. FMc2]|uniref:S1C family serine protease n=1 Tax=Parafrankia sp. FMc2 TaxID=3233196 RepID=UPI0034D5C288